tara:strand:- start:2118 stop:2360 length:243 start_codon:yes stop_codon:yes gene_type:complete
MKASQRKPKVANCYKVGDLVEAIPEYDMGSKSSFPSLKHSFQGLGVIVELQWPEKAKILINSGEVVCIPLEKIQIIKKEK